MQDNIRDREYGKFDITGAVKTIDLEHSKVHEGVTFRVGKPLSTGNGAFYRYIVKCNGRSPHLTGAVAAGGDTEVKFYEVVGYTGGTEEIPVAMNRRRGGTSQVEIISNPATVDISEAVKLMDSIVLGGSGGQAVGNELRQGTEFVLHPEKTYLLEAKNISGQARIISINMQWYE